MKIEAVDFYCFSGTGNTLLAARRMAEVFADSGIQVSLRAMERSDPATVDTGKALGLAFPVAAQGTYRFVWDFMQALPQAQGTPVFMADTMAKFSGGIVGPARRLLAGKGYTPVGAREFVMPSNFLGKRIDDEKNHKIIEQGLEAAADFTRDILAGKAEWKRIPLLSDFMSACSRSKASWRMMRRLLPVNLDRDKCVKCGLCADLCPVENIAMGEYPVFGAACQLCMRCVSFCPQDALRVGKGGYARYRAVSAADIKAIREENG